MAEIKPRYEFRVWADSLEHTRKRLERMAAPREAQTSHESYVVSATTDKCNAKIRAGLMDIKLLIAEERGLQQWKPVLKAEFPLSRSIISAQIFPNLAVQTPPLAREQYSLDQFFDELIRKEAKLAIVEVSKTRFQFDLDNGQAEFTTAAINRVARQTVAVESVDPAAVLRTISELALQGAPNISYIREIKRIIDK
jgi:hypothetical protein